MLFYRKEFSHAFLNTCLRSTSRYRYIVQLYFYNFLRDKIGSARFKFNW